MIITPLIRGVAYTPISIYIPISGKTSHLHWYSLRGEGWGNERGNGIGPRISTNLANKPKWAENNFCKKRFIHTYIHWVWKEYCTEYQISQMVEKHLQKFYSRVMVFLMMHHEYYYIISLEVFKGIQLKSVNTKIMHT